MFGKRINLQEIEILIRDEFNLHEIAAAGIDDHLYIFVTVDNLNREIKNYLHRKLDLHPSSICVKKLDEIPRNASGKIRYSELEQA